MGFLASGTTLSLTTHFTDYGREFFLFNDFNDVKYFSLGDSDINYNSADFNLNGQTLDVAGNLSDAYRNVASGTEIRHRLFAGSDTVSASAPYKLIETGNTQVDFSYEYLGQVTVTGATFRFSKIDRTNTASVYSNVYFATGLPVSETQKEPFTIPYSGGGWADTAFSDFNVDRAIIAEISKDEYGEFIDGKNIRVKVPVVLPGGPTTYTCYGTYMYSPTAVTSYDAFYSEYDTRAALLGDPVSSAPYKSNIVLLFSDDVKKPNGGDALLYWGTGFGDKKPFKKGKPTYNFQRIEQEGRYQDTPVGFAILNKGVCVFTHPDIVDNFRYSAGTRNGVAYSGAASFDNVYFTDESLARGDFHTYKTNIVNHFTCIAAPNEFYQSANPTFIEGSGAATYITEIGLYDENMKLVLLTKLNYPVKRTRFNYNIFDIQVAM